MKRFLMGVLVVLVVAVISCTSSTPKSRSAKRLVMVSYDGLGADLVTKWKQAAVLDQPQGLRSLMENGRVAERMRMVNPTSTAVNHISLITGKSPSQTGIVSNRFRYPGTALERRESGFSAPFEGEALWSAARRQGKRVGILLWPGSDATALSRMGNFGVFWPEEPLLGSTIIDLDPESATPNMEFPVHDGIQAISWTVTTRLPGTDEDREEYLVAAFDSAPDGISRFDSIAVRNAAELSWQYLGIREWFEMRVMAAARGDLREYPYGSWAKILRLDRRTGQIKLYRGAFWRLLAYPLDFSQALVNRIGPWPGTPDKKMIARWWLDADDGIDLDTFLEQAERLDRYIDAMAAYAFESDNFDLLLTYHSTVDDYLHSNNIVDPQQWAYSPGKAVAAREGLKRIGRSVDHSVASLWQKLDPDNDVLVVVSDHGLARLNDVVRINRVLAEAGLVKIDESGPRARVHPDSPMIAVTLAGCAHIYLNLEGREPNGVVDPTRSTNVLVHASRVLADLEVDGKAVVEKIVTRHEAKTFSLAHPNSGDLVVFLYPGFTASGSLAGETIEASHSYAQHGYLNHHDSMTGFFGARGAQLRPDEIGEIST